MKTLLSSLFSPELFHDLKRLHDLDGACGIRVLLGPETLDSSMALLWEL